MGYYTNYTLDLEDDRLDISDVISDKELDLLTGYTWDDYKLYEVKWYGHDEDMLSLSKRHPEIVFRLEGEGEDQPDLWRRYYKNGKMQEARAIITYPKYNEDLLK